jgi:hypothetical protein
LFKHLWHLVCKDNARHDDFGAWRRGYFTEAIKSIRDS